MIEQNKYTDETIHVANWLLLSGNVDLEELIAQSHRETAIDRKSPDEENDRDYEDNFKDNLAYFIREAIENAISEAMPDVDACGIISQRWGFPNNVEDIQDSTPTWFLTPFISQALEKVDFDDVAKLLLTHSPAGTLATA